MKKINWGVLGTAGIARGCTIPGMQLARNCNLYAIAGRSLEKAEAFQAEFGFQKAFGSYEELLADPAVEAVYIPLPNELHKQWAIKALGAGKHVLCEKPLAPTAADMEEMFAAAEEKGVYLMEAYAYLHSPIMAAIKKEIDAGTVGNVRYIDSCFITSDYDISNIRMRKETFGGCTYDLGCYCTTQILWLLGTEPERVQAVGSFSDRNIDLLTTGILDFDGGVKATFQCGMVLATEQDKRIDRLVIHGSKGSISSDVRFNQCGRVCYTVTTDAGVRQEFVDVPQNYALEVEQLGRCIAGEETPHVSKEFSLMNARVLERILEKIGY